MPATRAKSDDQHPKLVAALLAWFAASARDLPWRRTLDPYAIWVSEIMLQQTQVKTVIPYWERWLRELPSVESLAKAKPEKIHKLWEGLGYYTRVRNMQKAAQQVVAQHGGRFPQMFDEVLALPGVGRYTAGAICSIAYNQPTPILDGNVIRVLTRVFGIGGDPRGKEVNAQLWQLAEELVSHAKAQKAQSKLHPAFANIAPLREENACSYLNQSLMELGALICTPRNAQCLLCPLQKMCAAFKTGRVDELPNLGKRVAATERQFTAFIVERDGKYLVRQRPEGVVNAHLWEFPNEEIGHPDESRHFTVAAEAQPACVVKHSITRYRITLTAYPAKARGKVEGEWRTLAQLDKLAFSSAHKKILARLKS